MDSTVDKRDTGQTGNQDSGDDSTRSTIADDDDETLLQSGVNEMDSTVDKRDTGQTGIQESGDDSTRSTIADDDDETLLHTEYKLSFLYLRFHHCKDFFENDALTQLLHEFVTVFVGRIFENFIQEVFDGRETTMEMIRKLGDELKKLRNLHATPNSFWESWFETEEDTRSSLNQKQLMSCAAATFASTSSEIDPMVLENIDVNDFNVPTLLDIISSCTLFDNERKYVIEIVDAYVSTELDTEHLPLYTKQMKTVILTLLNQIDDTMLPGKERYKKRVELHTIPDPVSVSKEMDEDELRANFESLQQDLNDPLYINWVKGTLTLKELSIATRAFVLAIFTKFKTDKLPDSGSHFDDGEKIKEMSAQVEWQPKDMKLRLPKHGINCHECKSFFEKVIQLHRRLNRNTAFSKCKDIPVGGAWGIARIYMQGLCGESRTPEEADAYVLFQLIRNCMLFEQDLKAIDTIIETRNKLMHSPHLKISDHELDALYTSELKFIEEAMKSKDLQDDTVRKQLSSSKKRIENIKKSHIDIDTIQDYGKAAIEYQLAELQKQTSRERGRINLEQKNTYRSKLQYYYVEKSYVLKTHFNRELDNIRQTTQQKYIQRIRDLENEKRERDEKILHLNILNRQAYDTLIERIRQFVGGWTFAAMEALGIFTRR